MHLLWNNVTTVIRLPIGLGKMVGKLATILTYFE